MTHDEHSHRDSNQSSAGGEPFAEARDADIGRGHPRPDHDQIEIIRPMWTTNQVLTLEAWDHSLRRAVIVRKLTPEAAKIASVGAEFWRQARNQARLRHDRILPVLFIDKLSGWVVTDFCGKRLFDEIGHSGMPADELRLILEQSLTGLAYLHDKGQIHGGLHPGVILIEVSNSVKLDFPSGREVGGELTLQSGLEKYAAPESLDETKFGAVGTGVDIYALVRPRWSY